MVATCLSTIYRRISQGTGEDTGVLLTDQTKGPLFPENGEQRVLGR